MRVPELELELEFEFNAIAELELELLNSTAPLATTRIETKEHQPSLFPMPLPITEKSTSLF